MHNTTSKISDSLQMIDSQSLATQMKDSYMANAENGMHGFGGIIRTTNPVTGRPLIKPNIFVQRGRTFALEKLFGDHAPDESGYIKNNNRTINLFRIGSGGAPANDLFSPLVPSPLDTNLSVIEPFRVVDVLRPDTFLLPGEENVYFQPVVEGNLTKYMAKAFDDTPRWVLNKADNKIYRSIEISINETDARNKKINELGLCISTADHTDIELFSRWTSDTVSFSGNTSMVYEYLVYA
jgi:hypothetical protein